MNLSEPETFRGKKRKKEEEIDIPLKIRPETPSDYSTITEVNDLAFGQPV